MGKRYYQAVASKLNLLMEFVTCWAFRCVLCYAILRDRGSTVSRTHAHVTVNHP